jgi:hypothetical protein
MNTRDLRTWLCDGGLETILAVACLAVSSLLLDGRLSGLTP